MKLLGDVSVDHEAFLVGNAIRLQTHFIFILEEEAVS
jgi:hypothetical protein